MKLSKREWTTSGGSTFIEYKVALPGAHTKKHEPPFITFSILKVERGPTWGRKHLAHLLRDARRRLINKREALDTPPAIG